MPKSAKVLPFGKPAPAPTPPAAPVAPEVPPKGKIEYSDRVVFVGMRESGDKSGQSAVFMKLTPAEIESRRVPTDPPGDRLLFYSSKITRQFLRCRPGAIFACLIGEAGNIQYQRGSMPADYIVDDIRLLWQSSHDAVQRSLAAKAAVIKESGRNLIEEACEPLRRAYQRCPTGMAKQQLLAEIVFRITRQK